MKVWTKVHIKDKNKQVNLISKAFTNYLYTYGPILNIFRKYNISAEDKKSLDKYISNRISGLLLLYLSKDYARINDIANKYNIDSSRIEDVIPEIEGYIEK